MGKRGVHVPQKIPGDPTDRHGFPALIEEFLVDLGSRGYSPATIRARKKRSNCSSIELRGRLAR